MSEDGLPLDNPLPVPWAFASEERLGRRNGLYRQLIGIHAEDVAASPVLEAGAGRAGRWSPSCDRTIAECVRVVRRGA